MSLYLYNLGISLQAPYPSQGRFYSSAISGLKQSGVWMKYQPQTLPGWVQDNVVFLNQPLNAPDWGNPQPDSNPFPVNPGDYMVVRLFLSDTPPPSTCLLRANIVFGRGISSPNATGSNLSQSPLMLNSSIPRAVVDSDNSTPAQAPTSDSAWAYCLGKIYGANNDYSFNVGVTLTQGGQWYTFGHDPQMHVGGTAAEIAA
jgi:hypothetical protein